ncbi:BirA family transcriptional regulator, biotin operon repressor / biotin-[acetyl-CoA-carboxylase] ligase [Faecalicatena contorta]|uniref:Bifunctional ligase/repressor BirA n=2 Tax=Faecalicatena contorta TaxID=39482 RepID=A0A315ZYL4_9FIRM|nr:BirA family biotin operon repressor/biotin-[acetyl-CoA-carboxylase] ligase [Faecalicatena contorta]SUQ14091.1 BirA family transcriptional regulator, biotin operon repressor / biotin-[acetyl-CoA-carboxylase] ligase [Faecalicatena contorta]
MLRESDGYVSGQELCEKLGVSRTAVWKAVNGLKEKGYQVEAVRNRGYRIIESPDILTKEELSSMIDTAWAGQTIYYFDQIDSTNIRAKQLGEEGAPHGTLIVAGQQNAGRGRRGRTWESPPGVSIYMSIVLRPEMAPVKAPMLTLVMALSAADSLKECTGLDVQIKWPNDIVLNGKKLAGILTEMSTEMDYINHVVIGVGINVNTERLPEELKEKATSLRLETGRIIRRSEIIASIMKEFEKNYQLFIETQGLGQMQEKYNSLLINREKEVRILGVKEGYAAYALGINEKGELLVRRDNGEIEAVLAGEVSVRGVYGYV